MHDPTSAQLRRSAVIRVFVATALAACATALWIIAAWGPLNVRTDIVGNPTLSNFNPYNYYRAYYLVVVFFPLSALLLFAGLTRLGPRLGLPVREPPGSLRDTSPLPVQGSPLDGEPPLAGAPTLERRLAGALRVVFVGSVIGLGGGIAGNTVWKGVMLGIAAYGLIAALGSEALSRWGPREWSPETRLSAANSLGAALAIVGLFAVSSVTQVQILSTGSVRNYPWFPLWLALPLAGTALAIVARGLRRAANEVDVACIERRAVLLIAAPILLYLLIASLPGDLATIDLFEGGQKVAATRLIGDGVFPWRDVLVAHGMLEDIFRPALGWTVFGNSYWGFISGLTLLQVPLYFISFYLLSLYLFGRNWPFLVLIGVLILGTSLAPEHFRFILWPLVLLMLARVLVHPTRLNSIALAFLAFGQTVITPEAVPGLLSIAVVLPLYELYGRQPGEPLARSFPRTLWVGGAGIAFAALFAGYLASQGALDDFIYLSYHLTQGHLLLGALPPSAVDMSSNLYYFAVFAPPAALLISFAYGVTRLRMRLRFRTEDWVMASICLFVFLYYLKFLARMDGHVLEPYSVALPLLLFILYRLITLAEREIRARAPAKLERYLTAHPVTLTLVVVVAFFAWGRLENRIDNAAAYYRPGVQHAPEFKRVGYTQSFDSSGYRDLKRIVDAYLRPNDRLFDFTDEPGLFFYLMGRDPSIRYFQISTVVQPAELQADVIDRLRQEQPKLIAFDNTNTAFIGMASYDGYPTSVHIYEVSQWILDHYRPLLEVRGHTFYIRKDLPLMPRKPLHLSEPAERRDVAFRNQPCNWGYAPTFLSGPGMPPKDAQGVDARARHVPAQETIMGWAGDPATRQPARKVIATVDGKAVERAVPNIERPDVVAFGLPRGYLRTGFQIQVPAAGRLHVYAISAAGKRSEIVADGATPQKGRVVIDGRRVPLDPAAVQGQINKTAKLQTTRFSLPAGSRWSDYRWLEVDAGPGGWKEGQFGIYDLRSRPSPYREIYFKTLDRSPQRYVIPVGSCAEWHGYRRPGLFLSSHPHQDITAVRLIR